MVAISLDIETCPLPLEDFSPIQKERYEKELKREEERNPDQPEEESSKRVRSFHPYLGWVCCVSVVRGKLSSGLGEPMSWTATSPENENYLLMEFWEAVDAVTNELNGLNHKWVWTTFNGKDFDVPFLTARSAHHGISPTSSKLLDSYPYGHNPHADLQTIWPSSNYGLDDMCAHLGVESPKEAIDGSEVAQAVSDGRMDEVKAYCERDAIATYRCLERVQWAL